MKEHETGPLFVCVDDLGIPSLYDDTPTDLDLNRRIVLDDVTLWEAYTAACAAIYLARQAVLRNLRKPARTEVKIMDLPTPTSDEIRGLACLHVTERLRYRQKINMAFCALAGVSKEQIESAWGLNASPAEQVSSEMVKALRSKGWIGDVGDDCYVLTGSGEDQLHTVVTATDIAKLRPS